MDSGDDVVSGVEVRTTDSIARAGDWSLVLHSAAIPHRIEIREAAIVIVVEEAARTAALASLEAFDLESLPVVRVPAPDLGPSPLGLALAVLIVALHVAIGTRRDGMGAVWFRAGSASAEAIVHGEWWRAVTALMLHADVLHLLGNVVGSLVFVSAVGRWLGVGLGGAVVLASAVTGNLLTAYFHQVRHVSVGASTATFAALGVVAGLQMVRRHRHRERGIRGYSWLPLAAGLGLIVMIGSGERADLVAHLAGLGAGVVAGWLVAATGVRVPGTVGQVGLAALTLGVIAASWLLAFRAF
ncbi:rhomboid family intramembrane serine protease [Luteitalea sp.]